MQTPHLFSLATGRRCLPVRWIVDVALVVSIALAVSIAFPAAAGAVDVIGDDEGDRYVGSGGLVLPGTVSDDTRIRVATCGDCRWRMTEPCAVDGHAQTCQSVTRGCTAGRQLLRAWISRDAGRTWEDLGLVCIPPSGPVTVADVERETHDEFEQALPPSSIRYQPNRGVLPYLPVVFHSGQPAGIPPVEVELAGVRVVLTPVPRWAWSFGDGGGLSTLSPGSVYPDLGVSHAYRVGGPQSVTVTTTWSATVMIDGLGPFDVQGPVIQQASTVVRVGQARAVLVP